MENNLEENVNTNSNGIIVAPAGCGKTESIIKIVNNYNSNKKVLILTHTNAGVENILKRLEKNKIQNSKFNVYTIASFCTKYINSFLLTSKVSDISNYNQIYEGMNNLLENSKIQTIIINTYSLLLVDEYQDCNIFQHNIIKRMSKILNYKLFGDPLQSIYKFENNYIELEKIINSDFKLLENMNYPWRWETTNKELGKWVMNSRKQIIANSFSLQNDALANVEYFKYSNYTELIIKAKSFLGNKGRNVVLFDLENKANIFCKKLGGKYYFQEEIECKALNNIIEYFDKKENGKIIKEIICLGEKCFTNFKTVLNNIILKINKNDFDLSKIRSKNKIIAESIMLAYDEFSYDRLIGIIDSINSNSELKIYRKELWTVLRILITKLKISDNESAKIVLNRIRSSNELNKKFKYRNLVSRILLVKGLEFDNVMFMYSTGLEKELLYVAISRATTKLIIAKQEEI